MLIHNRILENYKAGKKSVGTFSIMGDMAVDALSYVDLDYVIMDMEHSALEDYQVEVACAIAAGRGYSPIVRVKDTNRTSVLRALDSGAHGMIVPNLKTMEQAEKLVEWAKFTPVGERGLSETRDCGWALGEQFTGTAEHYFEYCNNNTLLMPQCETVECLEIVDKIAAMDGIDGIFVGPYDLSLSMGIPVQFDNPRFVEALDTILKSCHAAGKICLIYADDPVTAKKRFEQGFDSVTTALDIVMLQNSYVEAVRKIREIM